MIEAVIGKWKDYLRTHDGTALEALLDDDVVFFSPVVYTPQIGKRLTLLYLTAAGQALPGGSIGASEDARDGRFAITKEVLAGDTAVLEFETTVGGKYVNGVDIIRCNAQGRIIEFRVMIRPLQAVNAVHTEMAKAIEGMQEHK